MGDRFLIEKPRRGGGGSPGREGPRGWEGVCGEMGDFFFGGAKFRDEKTWAVAKRRFCYKHFQGAISELNSLYFPRKTP